MMLRGVPYKNHPILFVDDDPVALFALQSLFGNDFTIHSALGGDEALRAIQAHPEIAVVISDQRMPKMSGLELITQISEQYPRIITMLLTGYTDLSVVIEALNNGNLYRYIAKPYDETELKQILAQGIERYYLVHERDRLHTQHLESIKKEAEMKRLSEIGILAATVAHNMNNSLVAINSFMRMIPEKKEEEMGGGKTSDFWQDFYFVALNEVARLQEMVSRFLHCAKWSDKEEPALPNLVETDLNSLLTGTVLSVSDHAHQKGIEIKTVLDTTVPNCFIDPEKIREVFMNLLVNAIDATSQGLIEVKTGWNGDSKVNIHVRDTGVGIPKENVDRLFIPFFSTKGEKGIGLGLMICRDVIDKHHGTIEVHSTVGVGTTVMVSLPRATLL
jgi:signal transduction histidine kinase